jgi:hypothetical protein
MKYLVGSSPSLVIFGERVDLSLAGDYHVIPICIAFIDVRQKNMICFSLTYTNISTDL